MIMQFKFNLRAFIMRLNGYNYGAHGDCVCLCVYAIIDE